MAEDLGKDQDIHRISIYKFLAGENSSRFFDYGNFKHGFNKISLKILDSVDIWPTQDDDVPDEELLAAQTFF